MEANGALNPQPAIKTTPTHNAKKIVLYFIRASFSGILQIRYTETLTKLSQRKGEELDHYRERQISRLGETRRR
ncbi:MAG: hypothetical protein KPEEDBHJ_02536 [Anaerolineales bacterium]|nr:hypothetical protein [Anaerolineales bacterium]